MTYIDEIAKSIGDWCDLSMSIADECDLLRIYAVLCLVKGSRTTCSDTHAAWCAWKTARDPLRNDVRPFEDLDQRSQDLNYVYRDAIRGASIQLARAKHDGLLG